MNEILLAADMYKTGMSMKDIATAVGKSAAWVCKGFKRIGLVARSEHTNRTSFTSEQAAYLLANSDKPYIELAVSIGKTAHAISQWLHKHGVSKRKAPNVAERPCGHCGASYKPKYAEQQFCSTVCMGAAKREIADKECVQCKKVFRPTTRTMKFCCVACSEEGFQKQHIKVRPYPYNGVNMRSTWEVKFAKWLDANGFEWKYEPKFFALPDRKRYCPDFFVPTHDAYYEIKGWMKDSAAKKIAQFRSLYPQESLVLVNKDTFKLYGIKL